MVIFNEDQRLFKLILCNNGNCIGSAENSQQLYHISLNGAYSYPGYDFRRLYLIVFYSPQTQPPIHIHLLQQPASPYPHQSGAVPLKAFLLSTTSFFCLFHFNFVCAFSFLPVAEMKEE